MPKLVTSEGEMDPAEVERRFAEAMAAPEPDEPMHPAPEPVDAETAEKPAETAEKPEHAKARTRASSGSSGRQKRARGGGKKKPAEEPPAPAEGAYTQPVAEFLQALTVVGATAPVPPGALRTKVRLQAMLVHQHAGGIATAVDAAARHNAVIRRGVEALTMGSAGWVLPAVLAVAPFAAQSAALWRGQVVDEMTAAADQFADAVKAQLQGGADAGPTAGA